jgi:L-lactate dehydrogenase complex protein LldG
MNVYEALKRKTIREGIYRSLRNLKDSVRRNLETHPYLLEYAEELRSAKLQVIENLDFWIERARSSLEDKGATVYFASNAEEARKIAGEIAGSGKVIVKAKSMVTEEIHLREYLESLGNEVWETDLGELIIQLSRGRPMHMVIPALHLSEKEVGEILRKISVQGSDAEELARGVREFLREKFLRADVGVSGCNAFSAETGRIFLIENEGDIRLATSLPQKYIAVVSVDKILPSDELALKSIMLQSAFFGTFPPAYINVNQKIEGQEMHVILLDNGRRNTKYREQLLCIRCGRCQLECPVFQLAGNFWGIEVYGGPMGIVWSAITSEINDNCFLSTLCGKCKVVCPMKIDMPRMIREIRRELVSNSL